MSYHYLFGPVSSGRLGRSLGVDLVPHKTCSFNCVYYECGKTTLLTTERAEYFPTSEVMAELNQFLSANPQLDYVTFSGAGEPTLYIRIGKILKRKFYRSKPLQIKTPLPPACPNYKRLCKN